MNIDLDVPFPVDNPPHLIHNLLGLCERSNYEIVAINYFSVNTLPRQKFSHSSIDYISKCIRPLKILSRLTLILDDPRKNFGISLENEIIRSYDLFAIFPTTELMLTSAVSSLDMDIICLDVSKNRLLDNCKFGLFKLISSRFITVELVSTTSPTDSYYQRNIISNARLISRMAKNCNIILSNQVKSCLQNYYFPVFFPCNNASYMDSIFGISNDENENCASTIKNSYKRRNSSHKNNKITLIKKTFILNTIFTC